MFEKKKKATKKNEDLMKKAPAADAVELGDDVLEAAAGGARKLWYPGGTEDIYKCGSCGSRVSRFCVVCPSCSSLLPPVRSHPGNYID